MIDDCFVVMLIMDLGSLLSIACMILHHLPRIQISKGTIVLREFIKGIVCPRRGMSRRRPRLLLLRRSRSCLCRRRGRHAQEIVGTRTCRRMMTIGRSKISQQVPTGSCWSRCALRSWWSMVMMMSVTGRRSGRWSIENIQGRGVSCGRSRLCHGWTGLLWSRCRDILSAEFFLVFKIVIFVNANAGYFGDNGRLPGRYGLTIIDTVHPNAQRVLFAITTRSDG